MEYEFIDQQSNISNNSIRPIFVKIKNGDASIKEKFIVDYKPYIMKTVSRLLGKFIDESSEEYSIGLLAFNEAIDFYDVNKNSNFFKYAELVIKHRLIDFIRINKRHSNDVPFSYFEEEESFEERYLIYDSLSQYEKIEVKEEIFLFEQQLKEFKISLEELVEYSPRHEDSRILCINIARIITQNDSLYSKMISKKMLPLSDLMKYVNVHKRTIERNRKYIIAVTLILKSNHEEMKGFFSSKHKKKDHVQ